MRDQKLWFWHIAAGVVVLVFLALHMAIMHLDSLINISNPAGGHPIDWANVVARGQSVFFATTYIVLLGAALFHGLYGLRNIIFEVVSGPGGPGGIGGSDEHGDDARSRLPHPPLRS
jgi:succinate dehydrogenase / fumarate reductase membrane anchor subunit